MRTPHKYRDLTPDEIEELFSNYLFNSVSFSKVNCFSRNEKAFEMQYLYNYPMKSSSNTVAGQAYHKALELYFNRLKEGENTDVVDMNCSAYELIESKPANLWKLQKSSPSIQQCQDDATKVSQTLILNFLKEVEVYTSEIKEILEVELKLSTWIRLNGVDIPLPLNAIIDMVVTTNDNKTVIIDHKSKRSFSDEKELKFSGSKQAIAYVIAYETETGNQIDEVWFVENKYSQNRDKSAQLIPFKIIIDDDTRRLYEAMLYEPLKRMLEAISNPDYLYLINDNDSFMDTAEIYEFWCLTMLGEIDDFDIPNEKKPLIQERLRKIRDVSLANISPTVIKNFKKYTEQFIPFDLSNKDMSIREKIEITLRSFGITSQVEHIFEGYSSASYLLALNAGIALSKVQSHKLDIAAALNVPNVRVQKDLFIYEGKAYLAVESGKKRTEDLMFDESKLEGMKIPIGLDNFKNTVYWDLDNHSTPHMLVCGATGSGKTVFLRSTAKYSLNAGVDEVIIFDTKNDKQLAFTGNPKVQTFSEVEDIELQMMMLVEEMQKRVQSGSFKHTLVIFDEFADVVANSRKGNDLKNYGQEITGQYKNGAPKFKTVVQSVDKSLNENLQILLQKGRSSGFRIVAATQRASTKVITGDSKVNLPVQVCFRVPKEVDSMVVIDEPGAESLNGRGDGLLKSPEYLSTIRFQAFYSE